MPSFIPKPPLDVLIITAVRDEYDAVLKVKDGAFPNSKWTKKKGPIGREIAFRSFLFPDGSPMRVGVTYATSMGQVATTEAAVTIVNAYQVRCLAMCGVCAGRRGKVNLGDVIVADRLWTYDVGKLIAEYNDKGERHEKVYGDMTTYNLDDRLKQSAEGWNSNPGVPRLGVRPFSYEHQELWLLDRLLSGEDPTIHPDCGKRCADWDKILKRLWEAEELKKDTLQLTLTGTRRIERKKLLGKGTLPKPEPFQLRVDPIGTGSRVIEDEQIFDRLSETMRKVLGLEMEASAIGQVQQAHRRDIPYMIVMKGVQDFADPTKNDNFRSFAARASAECLIAFLRQNLPPSRAPGYDDILDPGISEPTEGRSPSALLHPRYATVPFYKEGRKALIHHLEDWLTSGRSVRARLLHGAGGIGKTRLMSYWCSLLRDQGWQAGFLRESAGPDWLERLLSLRQPILAVIDYAESRANLKAILDHPLSLYRSGVDTPVRIVLLSRNAGDWWETFIKKEVDLADMLLDAPPEEIPPLAARPKERKEVFDEAVKAFAGTLKRNAPRHLSPSLDDPLFDLVLYIHMAALAAVYGEKYDPPSLMDTILDHEERFWVKQDDAEPDTWTERARQLVVAATLLGGFPHKEDVKETSRRLFDAPATYEELLRLHRIYGDKPDTPPYINPLQPDLLGEAMVLRLLKKPFQRPQDYITRVFAQSSPQQLLRGFEVLGRAGTGASGDDIRIWIRELLEGDLDSRCVPAFNAAMAVGTRTAFSPLADVLFESLEKENRAEFAVVLDRLGIPQSTVSMRKLAAWVNKTLIAQKTIARDAPGGADVPLAERARLLNNYSVRQRDLGDRKAALKSAAEAVKIYRELSDKNPGAFLPDLAGSLNNLGNMQSGLEDPEGALTSAMEAFDVYWPFFERYPKGFVHYVTGVARNVLRLSKESGQPLSPRLVERFEHLNAFLEQQKGDHDQP